ncbi:sn-glycerol-3-phosphate ABC transporter ATP-binding protein UgpC [Dietzia aerolata]|uniref:ABC transporter ATP-binding protein n=1 Tax=Dietzia aerolata TaxID=595984 RepID=A0ABV5JWE4_9ACTN|nr:sn-glycerol-3-phosphate ABC transporter ATP-binding protein UgpC [Dietzia aerolata]MBB0967775.1 sn-glycerol-3-phosphate ABC transporter ATP-binding protein UgpC [Dietzia aerolata]HIW67354.1 sn-glycerol-3-phosphate ABC transporter ATP-binding protein UgpC [Candidatus Dietzia merdigallinarum]
MATVRFAGATRRFDTSSAPAVDSLDIDIADGEFLVLVGPSGCGKSTSLRMLAGLEPVDEGTIYIDDEDMTRVAPRDRDVAMVFQNYALYPTMTVAQNMGFALRNAGVSRADTRKQVEEAARILQLEDLLGRKPSQLSGGQRQRVAMGRAIVRRPKVFCMDEPLSNLDAKLRVSTRGEIAGLQRRLGVTTVYVTHDQVEAMTMGTRVAVLKGGVLQQIAAPRELYDRPVNAFVAGFIGTPAMNLVEVPVDGGRAMVGTAGVDVPASLDGRDRILLGARPEALRVVGESEPGMEFVVDLVEELGAESFAYGSTESGERLAIRLDRAHSTAVGERLRVRHLDSEVHAFDTETGLRVD